MVVEQRAAVRAGTRGAALALIVALVAAFGAGSAPAARAPAPWQAFDALDGALFDAELAATTGDRAALASAGRRAAAAADELAARMDPSAEASADRLRRSADAIASQRRAVDLAVEAATARAAALAGAYDTILAATRAGDLDRARSWLLVREFELVTRFSHPSAASSVAIASLADGVVSRAGAVRSVRGDLLDTYEALLRTSLTDTEDALRAGFPEKAAGSAATARGYWQILRSRTTCSRSARLRSARTSRHAGPASSSATSGSSRSSTGAASRAGRSSCRSRSRRRSPSVTAPRRRSATSSRTWPVVTSRRRARCSMPWPASTPASPTRSAERRSPIPRR